MVLLALALPANQPPAPPAVRLQTRALAWSLGADGTTASFVDRASRRNCAAPGSHPFATVRLAGQSHPCIALVREGDRLRLGFGGGRSAVLRVTEAPHSLVFDVVEVTGDADELVFAHLPLALKGEAGERFGACVLARNLQTNVPELPGPGPLLRAVAYRRLGMAGASAAVVAGPTTKLRGLLQQAVAAAPELPRSPIGGPWALDSPANRGSYLFNFGGLNATAAPKWIALAHALGARQIDFHGGSSFRFGDFQPDPATYPGGIADLKAAVDALHAAGLQAGLHTYACFIDKRSKYVTPVPDPRLAASRTFTLAAPLDAAATEVVVAEPTEGLGPTTGFFVANSATLRIGEELVTFTGASQSPPWRFTGCTRGALGTRASSHAAGDRAAHLKELFGLFVPDAESTLYTEIAENTARTYNACGFDMIYLDALDGSYIHEGAEWAWYHGARFVYELWKRLERPAIMEMSTFHHHLWPVRARMGAWDAPHTGFKEFVDMHRVVNRDCARMYLPSHLGWWGVFDWNGVQPDRTLPDDLEYLLCKALADDAGVSFVAGFAPDTLGASEGARRSAALIRRYEDLRRSGKVPERVRKRLGEPMAEFTLADTQRGPAFHPVEYSRHVAGSGGAWTVRNRFDAQPARIRVEALLSPRATAADALLVPAAVEGLTTLRCAEGVTLQVTREEPAGEPGVPSLRLAATSARTTRMGSWATVERELPAPVDMTGKGLGLWVRGDGKGEVLNIQLRNAPNVGPAAAEHYVVIDFTGWRHITLVEPESERLSAYSWPYAGSRPEWEQNPGLAFTSAYKLHHPWLHYDRVAAVGLWLNNLPAGGSVDVQVGPVTAVPLVPAPVSNPRVTVAGATVTFPITLESGQYLEWSPGADAVVYGPAGATVRTVAVPGPAPTVPRGEVPVTFTCDVAAGPPPRARVTVITRGPALR